MAEEVMQELKDMNVGQQEVSSEENRGQCSPSYEDTEGIPGVVNEAFESSVKSQESAILLNVMPGDESMMSELSPLTYVDFLPRCVNVETPIPGHIPEFAQFRTVMEQANQWLLSMPSYKVYKVETIDKKLSRDMKLDLDTTVHHISSNGQTTYVRGVRLWIVPQTDPTDDPQQISYISVMPERVSGNNTDSFSSLPLSSFRLRPEVPVPSYDTLQTTIEKLNRHLQHRPLPGKILNMETFHLKLVETLKMSEKPDPEKSCWSDCGNLSRLFLYSIRIYYIPGQQKFETIGLHDEVPDIVQTPEGINVRIKYAPFTQVVSRTAKWIQEQCKDIRIVNLQSLNIKADRHSGGQINLNSDVSGYGEQPFTDSQYVKILRTFYVKEQKSKSETSDKYTDVNLVSRLFVPIRRKGIKFEPFSKTMQRAIAWLQITNSPIFGMETVQYMVNPDSVGTGVNDERVDVHINNNTGRYYLTCIRIYFSDQFEEPSVDLLPRVAEDEAGWGCVIS